MEENYISRLSQILAAGGWTQKQLAERLGVTFAALNRWLQGHAKPQPRRLTAIQALYKEVVGYPSVTDKSIAQAVRQTNKFRKADLWSQIAHHSSLQDDLLLEHT